MAIKNVEGVPESVFIENIPLVEGYFDVAFFNAEPTDDPKVYKHTDGLKLRRFYVNLN